MPLLHFNHVHCIQGVRDRNQGAELGCVSVNAVQVWQQALQDSVQGSGSSVCTLGTAHNRLFRCSHLLEGAGGASLV
jgi:hypothetical protein